MIKYNEGAISSLKACPTSGQTIAVADDNGAVVFYQMDAEPDEQLQQLNLPQEYLFLHCGEDEPKEVTWCGPADGFSAIVDANGIQIIRPDNL